MLYSFGKGSETVKNRQRIKNITLTALGTVLLAICSWISIFGITLQTFAVFFMIYMFGARRATVIITVYLAMGALGLPVFSGFGGGIGWLLGPTGGFLLCFLLVGVLHILAEAIFKSSVARWYVKLPLSVISVLCCYLCGACSMYFYYLKTGSSISFFGVFVYLIAVYTLLDAVKIIFAYYLAKYFKRIMPI